MTSSYFNLERLTHRRLNGGIFVLMLIFLGVAFAPTDCQAQAVPTRNQSHIMTRPTVRPPEPPLEKEIRETRQEVEKNKRDLARRENIQAMQQLLTERVADLAMAPDKYHKKHIQNDINAIKAKIEEEKRKLK